MIDLCAMADRANWSAANAHFADGDWGYCAGCDKVILDEGVNVDGVYYCQRCVDKMEAEDDK